MTVYPEWKAIPGYEGWYDASPSGQIRRLRAVYNGKGVMPAPDVKVLAPLWYRKGYYKVQLGTCGGTVKRKREYIHRVIYRTFVGPIPDGMTINHIDGNPANNSISNLELATYTEQVHHARRIGLSWHWSNGQKKKPSLTAADVVEIRRVLAETPPPTNPTRDMLAARYNVSPSLIRFIEIRRVWKHV